MGSVSSLDNHRFKKSLQDKIWEHPEIVLVREYIAENQDKMPLSLQNALINQGVVKAMHDITMTEFRRRKPFQYYTYQIFFKPFAWMRIYLQCALVLITHGTLYKLFKRRMDLHAYTRGKGKD